MVNKETNRVEHKIQLTPELDLEKEVISFLNYLEGGFIYIGIDKEGEVKGVEDLDGDMLKIKDRVKHNISPSAMGLFDIVAEEIEGKNIIKIIVACGSERPYFKKKFGMTEKGCFIRIGTAAEPMPQKMIEELFASRTRNSIGKIKAAQQDLTFEQLRIYYEENQKPLNKQFLRNLELKTSQDDLNYAAYLLADRNNISIKLAKYKGKTRLDLIENNEYGYVSLIKATKSVLDKINIENRTITKITSKEREEKRLWHPIALREAIINAFVHNDYTRENAPKFEIFDDRIEITSNGSLPEGLSKAEFFEGFSIPRNKELMRVFKDLDLVEQLGSGIPRILEFYSKDDFVFSKNFLRVTLPSSEKLTEQVIEQVTPQVNISRLQKKFGSLAYRMELDATDNKIFIQDNYPAYLSYLDSTFGITSEKLRDNFGKASGKDISNVTMTLFLIGMDSKITAQEIGQILGVTSRTSEKYFQKLRERKLIKRKGGRKDGYWQILKQ